MTFLKRTFLFLAVNFLVVMTLSIVAQVLGIKPYLSATGIDFGSLLAFCFVWGMGGAFISLAMSRVMAKWMMGVQVIDPDTADPRLRNLVLTVHALAKKASLPAMPEVGIYEGEEINAFATGPSKARSLVAVSSGLLNKMDQAEVEGVLGHEVAHIANGDMVTMTLIQGVVNAFVMFFARVIAYALTMTRSQDDESPRGPSASYYIVQFVLEIVFMILGSMVVAWFSRQREYRADSGGARLAGKNKMIQALEGLIKAHETPVPENQGAIAALKISGRPSSFLSLFSTHPPLEDRIARLKGIGE